MTRARDVASALSGALSSSDAVSQTLSNKTIDGNDNTIVTKRGGTSSRPSTPTTGTLYYNTDDDKLQIYDAGWTNVYQAPAVILSGISPSTAATTGTSITISGSYIQTGATVKFIGSDNTERSAATVSVTSGEELVATTPSLPVAYEPYDVKVINPDGQNATLSDVLDAGGTPTWNTPSGTLSTINEGISLSTSVSATDPDGTSIVYSSSNLPEWISLNSSTGALTGTAPEVLSDTTYNFNVTASDGLNTSSRAFAVTVNNVLPIIVVDYLVVAGGASGGSRNGSFGSGHGGGGAGGLRSTVTATGGSGSLETALTLNLSTNYTVTVGGGGAGITGPADTYSNGNPGSNSIFSTITSSGGGYGAAGSSSGGSGGSGGGAGYSGSGGSASPSNQGFSGGSANSMSSPYAAGGGGGAGGVGGNAINSSSPGTSGPGRAISITGSSVTYAVGGAGCDWNSGGSSNAAANTGNGSNGAALAASGNGGSGVVILKYPNSKTATISVGLTHSTSTAVSGYKVTTFTAGTGTVSFA